MDAYPYKLKKRGKIWHYIFHINKQRYRGTTGAVSKELAAKFTNDLYRGIYQSGHGLSTQKVLIKDFIIEHVRQGQNSLSLQWLYTKELMLMEFLNFAAEQDVKCLDEIRLEHLERYKTMRLQKNKPKTVQNHLRTIGALLNHAVRLDYIDKNPCARLSKVKGIERNKKRFLSKDETEVLLNETKGTYLETFVLTAIYTGMRRRELIHLEFSDVDFSKKLLYVRNKEGFQTKSRKERVMPLHKKLWPLFKVKKEGICFPYDVPPNNRPSTKTADKRASTMIQEDTASRNFRTMAGKAGLPDIGLHTLRHTFISHCLMSGISMWEVSQWAGHSSSYITELYGHLCPDRREIDRLAI